MLSDRLSEGTLLNGRYEILEILGHGGMGTVYRARDTRLDTIVAVKEMRDSDTLPEEREAAARQFEREAKMVAQLSHPNLPRVTDYFIEHNRWYLIMEFIAGETLATWLRDAAGAPLPLLDVLQVAVQLTDSLAFLHRQTPPIVFRDVKPANIMVLENGAIKLIDFGIARRFLDDATKDTLLYGSPGYSPPEQYGRAQTDPRSDLYAMGATLHHLLTGRDPASTPFKFPPLRSLDPTLPPALETFVARCVEMDVDRRYRSMEEAREILLQIRAAVVVAPTSRDLSTPSNVLKNENDRPRIVSSRRETSKRAPIGQWFSAVVALLVAVLGLAALLYAMHSTHSTRVVTSPLAAGIPNSTTVGPGSDSSTTPDRSALAPPTLTFPSPTTTIPQDTNVVSTPQEPTPDGPAPSADIEQVIGQTGNVPSASHPGFERVGAQIYVRFRVNKAAGKSGIVSVFFYGPDQVTPLKPAPGSGGGYQNTAGQLSLADSFHADADPAEISDFELFIPRAAFPVPYSQITYRVILYMDGKEIGASDISPLASS